MTVGKPLQAEIPGRAFRVPPRSVMELTMSGGAPASCSSPLACWSSKGIGSVARSTDICGHRADLSPLGRGGVPVELPAAARPGCDAYRGSLVISPEGRGYRASVRIEIVD